MFWIGAAIVLGALLALALLFDRRRNRSGGGINAPDQDPMNIRARDEHVRHRLQNPAGEQGPRP